MLSLNLNAQWYNRQFHVKNFNDLNQSQLNLALQKSIKTIRTGQILFFGGIVVGTIGLSYTKAESLGPVSAVNDAALLNVGWVVAAIGIPVWVRGANRKYDIQIALAKFQPTGSINGIGLKIRF
jgi:hypothetical protein